MPIEQFKKDRSRRDGYNSCCSDCRRIKGAVHTYKITKEEAIKLYSQTNCEICNIDFSTTKKSGHIDHDHETGEIKGVLCVNCNSALGKFQESTELLQRAIKYLLRRSDTPTSIYWKKNGNN